jgi:hypothetical protein
MTSTGRQGRRAACLGASRIFSPPNVELLIALISWLTVFGLIAALIAEALH